MKRRQDYSPAAVAFYQSTTNLAEREAPATDKIWFWDSSAKQWTYLTPNTNLTISGTDLNATGGAPPDADYLVKTAHAGLSAERVVTDTATVAWDWATAAQAKANVPDHAISNAKLRQGGACSVIGRSANSTGDDADISAAANGKYLQRNGDVVLFDSIQGGDLPTNLPIITVTKIYRALLNQNGTLQPSPTILENSLGGTPTFTRSAAGLYVMTLSGAWVASKTMIFMGTSSPDVGNAGIFDVIQAVRTSVNAITISSGYFDTGTYTRDDNLLVDTEISVSVYP